MPKVNRRLKDLTTIPPMTPININFKIKRNLGDIPRLGTKHSHLGNKMFPAWE